LVREAYVPSRPKAVSRRSNRLTLLDSDHMHAANTSTTANYVNVAYDSLTYNMASATLNIE